MTGGGFSTFNQSNFNIMANYPTFKLEGREEQYLTTVWDSKMWNVSAMPNKLYLHTGNGALVAIRPKFFTQVRCDTGHVEGSSHIFGFDMAGQGPCELRVKTYNGPSILFKTPEDFERYRATGQGAYQPDCVSAGDILRVEGYSRDRWGIVLWFNKNGLPSSSSSFFGFRVWIDRDGAHADHQPSKPGYGTLYKTREDCAAALSKMQVVDFDDEPEEETKPELTAFEDRLAEVIYDAIGECDAKVMDECCDQARKYSKGLLELAKNED